MSGCVTCGRPTPRRKCCACEIDERAEERAEASEYDHPECPSCGKTTSREGVECYRCRRGNGVETDGGVPAGNSIDPFVCPRGHHAVSLFANRFSCETCRANGLEPTSWLKSDLVDLCEEKPPLVDESDDEGLVTDGGSIRGLEAADDIERHLRGVLDEADDQEARRHAREALQHLAREGGR